MNNGPGKNPGTIIFLGEPHQITYLPFRLEARELGWHPQNPSWPA
jgi:hypothetical protein